MVEQRRVLTLTSHARVRLAERGITVEDIRSVLARPLGGPGPGIRGTVVISGVARGRLLVVILGNDGGTVVTAFWRGDGNA